MRTPALIASTFISLALVAVGVSWVRETEAIQVRAVESVPLFDPESLAGEFGEPLRAVGQLAPGQELSVVACKDRKSDINLLASFQGKEVVVGEWKAKVQLLRRSAYPWESGATVSCRGYFQSVSAHA